MKLIENLDNIIELNLPYPFLKEYNSFENTISKCVYVISQNGKLIMPVKIEKVFFLKRLNIIYPPVTIEGDKPTLIEEQNFLNEFIIYCKKNNLADRIAQPLLLNAFQTYPSKSIFCEFGQMVIETEIQTEDEIFNGINSRDRRYIKAAPKSGAICKFEDCIEDFYKVFKETMISNNLFYHDLKYFQDFQNHLPNNVLCGVVYVNGVAEGSLFICYTNHSAFFLYGGAIEQKVKGSVKLLHYEAFKILKLKGVKQCVLGGARINVSPSKKQHGIQQFKEKLETIMTVGYLWKKDINILKCFIFDGLVISKNMLTLRKKHLDVIDQERK